MAPRGQSKACLCSEARRRGFCRDIHRNCRRYRRPHHLSLISQLLTTHVMSVLLRPQHAVHLHGGIPVCVTSSSACMMCLFMELCGPTSICEKGGRTSGSVVSAGQGPLKGSGPLATTSWRCASSSCFFLRFFSCYFSTSRTSTEPSPHRSGRSPGERRSFTFRESARRGESLCDRCSTYGLAFLLLRGMRNEQDLCLTEDCWLHPASPYI